MKLFFDNELNIFLWNIVIALVHIDMFIIHRKAIKNSQHTWNENKMLESINEGSFNFYFVEAMDDIKI